MMNAEALQKEIETILLKEFQVYEVHSRMTTLTNAIAQAVVAHIQRNAKAQDLGPYSPGQWKIL